MLLRMRQLLILAGLVVAAGSAAQAQEAGDMLPTGTVPLVSFGVGKFDVFDNVERDTAADFRFEYRFADPLLYVIKPLVGVEATSDGGAGVLGGIVADWVLDQHWVVAPSFSVVAWAHGGGKDMGSVLEFRSQIEAGYRFDNDWRLTASLSHMSNADISDTNPGVEVGAVYLHVPADTIFPH